MFYGLEYGLPEWGSMCTWKKFVFCYCWVECSINVSSSLLIMFYRSYWFSAYLFIDWWARSIAVSYCNCGLVYFSIELCQFLLHVFCLFLTQIYQLSFLSICFIILCQIIFMSCWSPLIWNNSSVFFFCLQ